MLFELMKSPEEHQAPDFAIRTRTVRPWLRKPSGCVSARQHGIFAALQQSACAQHHASFGGQMGINHIENPLQCSMERRYSEACHETTEKLQADGGIRRVAEWLME